MTGWNLWLFDAGAIWITLGFALLMSASWLWGALVGKRASRRGLTSKKGTFDDAALAVLGLLLAFSFAAASERMDARKLMVIEEATAIGDFARTSSLLPEPYRTEIGSEVRRYVQLRVEFGELHFDAPQLPGVIRATLHSRDTLTEAVRRVLRENVSPTFHNTLVGSLIAFTSKYETRTAMLLDFLPASIIILLAIGAAGSSFAVGRNQGVHGHHDVISAALFISMVSLLVFTIIDLQQPRRGLIVVPQAAMLRLRDDLPR